MSILPTHIAFVLVWSIANNRNKINKTSNNVNLPDWNHPLYFEYCKSCYWHWWLFSTIFLQSNGKHGIKYEDAWFTTLKFWSWGYNLCLPVVFTDKSDSTPGGHVKNLHPLKSVTLCIVKAIHSFLN